MAVLLQYEVVMLEVIYAESRIVPVLRARHHLLDVRTEFGHFRSLTVREP